MGLKRTTGLVVAAVVVMAAPAAGANGNGRVAYETGGSIYAIDAAGGDPSLVHAGYLPAFSPDGTRVAFAETPAGAVWVAGADGSNPVQIASNHFLSKLVWSADGTRVAYISGDYSSGFSVSVAKADGSGSSVVSQDASADALPPSWSPDGTELAFTTTNDTDIAVAKADASGRRLLIQDATQDLAPSWSPDGSRIAFFRGVYGAFVVYTIRPDGSGLHQLGQTQVDTTSPPAWSPDSSRLVFGSRQPIGYSRYGFYYGNNVYTVSADGAGERRLTDSLSTDAGGNPSWSPDGSRIVFTSARMRPGGPQLFVMNSDGSCETQLTSGSVQASSPSWQARAAAPADPLRCAAISISGSLDVDRDHPALDDSRIYVYNAVIANNGNVTSDPLRFVTTDESPFSYVSATASSGVCAIGPSASCTLPALPPGGRIDLQLRFNAFVAGTYPLEGTVETTGKTPDGDRSDNTDEPYRTFPFCEVSTQNGSTLRAAGGDDLICGTDGRDRIVAGAGDDRVLAGPGRDIVHGGDGVDEIDGGDGTDLIYGDGDRDKIHGGNNNDVLIGGSGPDLLWGDIGGDFLKGGPGDDRFFGGYGNDVIDSRDGSTEHVYCGEGKDHVEADFRDIVSGDCEKVVRRPARTAQARAPR